MHYNVDTGHASVEGQVGVMDLQGPTLAEVAVKAEHVAEAEKSKKVQESTIQQRSRLGLATHAVQDGGFWSRSLACHLYRQYGFLQQEFYVAGARYHRDLSERGAHDRSQCTGVFGLLYTNILACQSSSESARVFFARARVSGGREILGPRIGSPLACFSMVGPTPM